MYLRSQPEFPTLGTFLEHLRGAGDLVTVAAAADPHLEITEIHRRTIAGGGPALLFSHPTGPAPLPIAVNLFGTPDRVAAGLGTTPSGIPALGRFLAWLRAPAPPKSLAEARTMMPGLRAALWSRPRRLARDPFADLEPDFRHLPVQTCWPGDAGPLITWPIVVTRPPGADDVGRYNLGIYRMQVLDGSRAILRWLPMRGGAAHHRQWAALGADMPVAVVVGADPATMLAAVMPAPENVTELALAGLLGGRRATLVPCRSVPLHVPASAEIVLEGTVSPDDTALEGPFGDHTGYYNAPQLFPVFRLKRLRVRPAAVYASTFTGRAPDEPSVIGAVMADLFLPLLQQQIPEVVDLWLPPEACSYRIAVVSIAKRYPGQARRVMMGLWSLLPQFTMTKFIIVVDDDIDARSWADVMWAVATRSDPSRDLVQVDRTPVDHLDFASALPGLGGKLGIDATTKILAEGRAEYAAMIMPDAAVGERVARRWNEFFPKLEVQP
ncbi:MULTISPECIES: UbiD family decarboxylase [Xanthobacter]|uniref:UbiD family decarboxylase n=1 Tax=Xanthobacter aminoxidans TaxID=186280 RepID=UPI00372C742D